MDGTIKCQRKADQMQTSEMKDERVGDQARQKEMATYIWSLVRRPTPALFLPLASPVVWPLATAMYTIPGINLPRRWKMLIYKVSVSEGCKWRASWQVVGSFGAGTPGLWGRLGLSGLSALECWSSGLGPLKHLRIR